ncbi:hypothetical protein [Kitasatospora sp. MAP5-34]|uniref:hypothetical protein n=1 Tax=Kitasatospora sp. MAP5-34 TaxID=3035102 RepID=UPI0024736462|nr:hypothetical protein [Kitasatospora sp. MAP5-34]MDH6579801.1 hypothetical protein [Kitasatospora sp. MAP5-34]
MADANIRIPAEARDRLAEIAAAEHLSLRAYLTRLADNLLTPAERAERAEQARAALADWNGYDPDAARTEQLDAELDRRLAEAGGGR